MAGNCTLSVDSTLGPWAGDNCRGGFDFTVTFEQAILTLIPASLFLIVSPFRTLFLAKKRITTLSHPLLFIKLTAVAIFIILQLALLALWTRDKSSKTYVSVPVAVVNLFVATLILGLSWLEHTRSIRPSTLLATYLFFTLLFDVVQVRTLWLQNAHTSLVGVFTCSAVVKATLLVLESKNKRRHLKTSYAQLPPESTSGIINRSVMWWLNELFHRGYRMLIPVDSLYQLDQSLSSDELAEKIGRAWKARTIPERRFEYPWAVLRAFWYPFLQAIIPRLFRIGFTIAQPFLITAALDLLTEPETAATNNQAYGIIGAAALIYLGIAISTLLSDHRLYRVITMFRGATVSLIYNRALEVPDGLYDESAAMTLMSTDTDRVAVALEQLSSCLAGVIQLPIGIYLLAREIGWVCVMPLVVVLVSFIGSTYLSKQIGGNQKRWVEAVQKRISLTSSMLAAMQSVKMMGLSQLLTTLVQDQRNRETKLMAGYRDNIVWMNVVANVPSIWSSVVTFAVYAIQASIQGSGTIGTTRAFTSLAIIGLVASPAGMLLSSAVSLAATVGCFERIQSFLLSNSRQDTRRLLGSTVEQPAVLTHSPEEIELQNIASSSSRSFAKTPALSVEDADIRPAPSADIVLQSISLSIPTNSVTMVIGPVASGKTTLLRALLGEIPCDRGFINISSNRVGYCAQTAWLPNVSIQGAICGTNYPDNVDAEWYQSTLKACALDRDIGLLAEGDETLIGSGSTVLSGGQKQRVALARAVYSRSDILILDDVLSALDTHTKKAVVEGLIGKNGLLREQRSTVVLVTHEARYLPYADKVLVLADGQVKREGTFEDIMRLGISDQIHLTIDDDEGDKGPMQSSPAVKPAQVKPKQDIEVEDLTRATGELAIYSYYFKSFGVWQAAMFFSLVTVNVFFLEIQSVWLNWWTAAGGGHIGYYLGVYVAFAALASFGQWGYLWAILCLISPRTGRKLHYTLLKTVMNAPQSFFSSTDSGTLLNRFSQDMTLIESQLPIGVLITVSNMLETIAGAALVATGYSYMAATIPFLVGAIWGLQHVYLRTSRQLRLLDLEAKSPLYSHFLETVHGLTTIRAFAWQNGSAAENHRLLDRSQRPYYLLYCVQRWLNLVLDLIVAAEAVLVVGLALGLRSGTSAGLLGISLTTIVSFNYSMTSLINGWTQLETSLGSVSRVRNFERDVKPESKEGENFQPPPDWPQKGMIEFRGVTASHNPDAVALREVSFKLEPGKKLGICGRTGSGKSSLVGTILRLLELDSGSISIDGIDLATVPRETIRQQLVTIPQHPLILVGSLRLNIDSHSEHPDSAVIHALERVGLWSVLSDRGGLDADLVASSLSKGQQQLLALARALLKKGRVLILDEPTSNVDTETDAVMQRVLREEFGDCTVLTVAHRLDTIMDCDCIAVMDQGRLVEYGAPQELLATKDGWFTNLARR
ncbi:putative ATP-binding cassette transporter [Xylariales sp. PMI_506]|nr:putative ATP-binding cassette transporter [Xylariales sp. PMI_506]